MILEGGSIAKDNIYWMEKYRTSHDKVKEEFKKIVPDITKSVFQDSGDSIGYLTLEDNM